MDPPIEEIVAKWASSAIIHIVETAEEKLEQVQISFHAELLRSPGYRSAKPSLRHTYWFLLIISPQRDFTLRPSSCFIGSVPNVVSNMLCCCMELLSMVPMGLPGIYERFRSKGLIGLIVTGILYRTTRSTCIRALAKLLVTASLFPSDLMCPQQQIADLVIAVTEKAKDFLNIGSPEVVSITLNLFIHTCHEYSTNLLLDSY